MVIQIASGAFIDSVTNFCTRSSIFATDTKPMLLIIHPRVVEEADFFCPFDNLTFHFALQMRT
jgi:hypothetical protein